MTDTPNEMRLARLAEWRRENETPQPVPSVADAMRENARPERVEMPGCARGQSTTQFCAYADDAFRKLAKADARAETAERKLAVARNALDRARYYARNYVNEDAATICEQALEDTK